MRNLGLLCCCLLLFSSSLGLAATKQTALEQQDCPQSTELTRLQAEIARLKNRQQSRFREQQRIEQEKQLIRLEAREEIDRFIQYAMGMALVLLGLIVWILLRMYRYQSRVSTILRNKNQLMNEQQLKLQQLTEEYRRLSHEDPLTGLKNRRFLDEHIRIEAAQAKRQIHAGQHPQMLIIFIDIDHFKSVNDRFGHHVGDQVLSGVARLLDQCARASDLIIRWGGEEFCWFCKDVAIDNAEQLCARFKQSLAQTIFEAEEQTFKVTCSFGIAPFPLTDNPEHDWKHALQLADEALYEAKRLGRNRWVGYRVIHWPVIEEDASLDIQTLIEQNNLVRFAGQ